nr:MAG TPA: hypothetical protein [Caudoviricetes sp.]DAP94076.1 MAG TPA: hypothetical protein [Caudoviricetes sp.]
MLNIYFTLNKVFFIMTVSKQTTTTNGEFENVL